MRNTVYSPVQTADEEELQMSLSNPIPFSGNNNNNNSSPVAPRNPASSPVSHYSPLEMEGSMNTGAISIHGDEEEEGESDEFDKSPGLLIKDESSSSSSLFRQAVQDYLFPPDLPRSCQLLRPENIAVPACYLLVGLLQGLSSPLINVFPLDLGATEAQQMTVSSIRSLPAS